MSRDAFSLARIAILSAAVVGVAWSMSWSEKARHYAQRPQVVCTEDAR